MTNNSDSSNPSQAKGQEAIRAIESPLAGVDARSLDALMAEDVENLKDPDVDRIVAELQRQRTGWERSEAEREAKPRGKGKAKAEGPGGTLSLKDLGF